jgi:hypothetical protein
MEEGEEEIDGEGSTPVQLARKIRHENKQAEKIEGVFIPQIIAYAHPREFSGVRVELRKSAD